MDYPRSFSHAMPSESQSRQLDFWVQAQEMPYGYEISPPPADTGMHDLGKYESRKGKMMRGDY